MKLTYIYNSCFVLEKMRQWAIVFDFYKDTSGENHQGYVNELMKNFEGRIYVLSSHSHLDHFNKQILKWRESHTDIQYIFSKEIFEKGKAKENEAHYLDLNEMYEDDLLKITALGSTDVGASFLVEVEGKCIFHAGDLNNWHWKDESTVEEIAEAELLYHAVLDGIAGRVRAFDLVMFPIDHRMGSDYMRGGEQFVERFSVRLFSPMHFGRNYDNCLAFSDFAATHQCQVIHWKHKGDAVEI